MSAANSFHDLKLEIALPVGAAVLASTVIASYLAEGRGLSKFPLAGKELGGYAKRRKYYYEHARDVYDEGYKQFRNAVFRVTDSEGDQIVLPIQYLEEISKLPDAVLSNVVALRDFTMADYTGLDPDSPITKHIIRADLTHNLTRMNDRLAAEVEQTVPEYFGRSRDWTPVRAYDSLLKIVAIVSGQIFVGSEHNRNPIYLNTSINYTVDLFKAASGIRAWPLWLRPIGRYWVPAINAVTEHRKRAKEFLVPIIQERRKKVAQGEEPEDDCLSWVMAKADKFDMKDDADIAETQLNLGLVAIHTTTSTATHIVFDLIAQCPEVIPAVREEIKQVLEENSGVMTTQALYQMKLLDSIMRESQRMSPTGVAKFPRRVLKDITMKDGTFFPAGSSLAIPTLSVNNDPALYPEPHVFNPYRFLDLRTGKAKDPLEYSNKEQYQYVSVKAENTGFGFGRHACPGRFFASNEIKLIVARILLDYDLRMPEGTKGRYMNIIRDNAVMPDPTKSIEVKYVGE